MKPTSKILTSLGVFALGTCIAVAQDGAPKGDGQGRIADFLKRADTNADGKISKDEFNEFSKRDSGDRFAKVDANADGFIDQTEVGQIAERLREGGMRRPGGEGASSGEGGFRRPPGSPEGERPAPRPEGDRPGPRPEGGDRPAPPEGQRPGGPGGPGQGGPGMINMDEIYGRMDKNADGSVDKEEYVEFSKQEVETRFTRLDENQDGKVSKEEMKSGMDRMRSMMRGPGGAPGGPEGMRRPGGEGPNGFRRPPGGEGGGEGGFRRPPQEGGTGKPRPEAEAEAPKKDPA